MINERGGINGRKIKFISVDDSAKSREAVERTRELVEQEKVLLMFGSFGTPGNLATAQYLNERKIPQLFVASGDEEWAHPSSFPWTMGWQPAFAPRGGCSPTTSRSAIPDRKIAVLWQNDQFGRGSVSGIEGRARRYRQTGSCADIAFDVSDNSSRSARLKSSKDSGAGDSGVQRRAGRRRARHPQGGRTGLASGDFC